MKLKKNNYFVIIFLVLLLAACNNKNVEGQKQVLPIFGVKMVNTQGDTVYQTIKDFSLLNQYKEVVTQQNVKDKIYVANFFFATCQSICPAMSTQLGRVQDAVKNDDEVMILSHTVNPMHDTAEVLMEYSGKYGAIKNKWHFLTGDKKQIYDLAKISYLVNAIEDDGTAEGFIHSEALLLIDKQRRIRGIYDGTDSLQVDRLIGDIKLLKTEK